MERATGILLHPTSLPSLYGIGDLGDQAYKFMDFLVRSGQRIWQILPLNPVGYGESPYQAFSAFACNHLLIDPWDLYRQGLLREDDLARVPCFKTNEVEFSSVIPYKMRLFRQAYERFRQKAPAEDYQRYLQNNAYWLPDYALFMALKEHFGGVPWQKWPEGLRKRDRGLLEVYRQNLQHLVDFHCFLQFTFARQWQELRNYAHRQRIKIMGDIPIFVAADSCDTWVNPQCFELDFQGRPAKVAGVPPDYFSPTGQCWGNPLYRWDVMRRDGYQWWVERLRLLLTQVDYIRLDHFRGFAAYWEIDARELTAVNGRWVQGPGEHFFNVLKQKLGQLPLVAEDLGHITPDVRQLKDRCGFPGMKVLQFLTAESWPPDRDDFQVIYYTGTHDNDTLLGWYYKNIRRFLDRPREDLNICREFIEALYSSPAAWVIVPFQDLLCLGSEARMNTPGTTKGNWRWRMEAGALNNNGLAVFLSELSAKYFR